MEEDTRIIDVIERVSKSVLNINILRVLQDYYYRTVPVKGLGSGFIFDEAGYILTNHHVIGDAQRILVTLANGQSSEGRIIGTLRSSDIGVIKIEAKGLTVAELGDSDKLRVGQRVFAIGNPFGLQGGPTVTSGVISAVNRTIQSEEGVFHNLVQTDAAINPGNSGGPLIDTEGKVVAICTAIIPYAQGIGFAIPINEAKSFAQEIQQYGSTMRPWLGITGLNLNRDISDHYNIPVERGVYVVSVTGDSPAERAGMEQGDIISELDGHRIDTVEEVQEVLSKRKVGDAVELSILRGRQRGRLQVTLEKMP